MCLYSSFFGGSDNAMINGILKEIRLEMGLTPKQFRENQDYNRHYQDAQQVANQMQHSTIIKTIRSLARQILLEYENKEFWGPSGHVYKVSKTNFINVYPNYLQSYEFPLISKATLEIIKKFPTVQLISHYHDGNVLLVPENQVEEIVSAMNEEVKLVGQKLGLQYPQALELKEEF